MTTVPVVTALMEIISPAATVTLCVVSLHVFAAPLMVQVTDWSEPPSRKVNAIVLPVPMLAER